MTDNGVQGLCVGVDQLGGRHRNDGPCQTLHHLWLFGTGVTEAGAQMAVRNLRALQSLDKGLAVQNVPLLAEIYRQHLRHNGRQHPVPKYAFSALVLNGFNNFPCGTAYKPDSLRLATLVCSIVTAVILCMSYDNLVGNRDLQCLQHLPHVRQLQIEANNRVTFDGGVLPLLAALGRGLLHLEIVSFANVNARAVMKDYPNLCYLRLTDNYDYSVTLPHEETETL